MAHINFFPFLSLSFFFFFFSPVSIYIICFPPHIVLLIFYRFLLHVENGANIPTADLATLSPLTGLIKYVGFLTL